MKLIKKFILITVILVSPLLSAGVDRIGNGADGVTYTERFFLFFVDKNLTLLDLYQYKYNEYAVQSKLNMHIFEHDHFVDIYKKIRLNICKPLSLEDSECYALANKLFDIFLVLPELFNLLEEQIHQMIWLLVDNVEEINDEGNLPDKLKDSMDNKIQLAHRKGNLVKIQKLGWIKDYLNYGRLDCINKVATITHEMIYRITELQGDLDSQRAREINARLYKYEVYEEMARANFLLTGKKIEANKILEIDHRLVLQSVKRAYAFDHNYSLREINDLTVFSECGESGGIASTELLDLLQFYSAFDPTITWQDIFARDGLADYIYDNVRMDQDRDGRFLSLSIYYCTRSRYEPLRLQDIAHLIIEYKKSMK